LVAALLATTCLTVFAQDAGATGATVSSAATYKVVAAGNDFGFRLLRQLITSGDSDNVIISPLSVSLALAMVYNGAGGSTREAMARTLEIAAIGDDLVNSASHQLLGSLRKADRAVQLQIANALWVESGFALSPTFVDHTQNFYDATARSLDFSGDPATAAAVINAWVNRNTRGKIPTIIDKLSQQTRLVLTDAVYFKGRWSQPFHQKATATRAFYLRSGGSVMIPMMLQSGDYGYLETPDFQAIRLPYGKDRFDMYVFLPRKSRAIANYGAAASGFLKSLDQTQWSAWVSGMSSSREGTIVLPKFELRYAVGLNDALKSMGMGVAFDPAHADLSRITGRPAQLWIDFVRHKTYLKVDEEGTEAAAATAVGVVGAAVMARPHPFEMIVDHPFFCAIAERDSGAVLFAGIIANPRAS
jgi:serine protease inhibitor